MSYVDRNQLMACANEKKFAHPQCKQFCVQVRPEYLVSATAQQSKKQKTPGVVFRSHDSIQRVPNNNGRGSGKTDERVSSKAFIQMTQTHQQSVKPQVVQMSPYTMKQSYQPEMQQSSLYTMTQSSPYTMKQSYQPDMQQSSPYTMTQSPRYEIRQSSPYTMTQSPRCETQQSSPYTMTQSPRCETQQSSPYTMTQSPRYETRQSSQHKTNSHSVKMNGSTLPMSQNCTQKSSFNAHPFISHQKHDLQPVTRKASSFDTMCIWFHKITGEQCLFQQGHNPGQQYTRPYIKPY
jgi:hypothetical protein